MDFKDIVQLQKKNNKSKLEFWKSWVKSLLEEGENSPKF